MQRPPAGICLPCRLHQVVRGNVIDVWMAGGVAWRLSLVECTTHEETAAKEFASELLEASPSLFVFVPQLTIRHASDAACLLHTLAPIREALVPAYLFVNEKLTLNEALVKAKLAKRT